jgi:hypothetical protein
MEGCIGPSFLVPLVSSVLVIVGPVGGPLLSALRRGAAVVMHE